MNELHPYPLLADGVVTKEPNKLTRKQQKTPTRLRLPKQKTDKNHKDISCD